MKNISLVMIVKNEAVKLKRCLMSAKELVEEIVVVDTGSTENVKEVAAEFGCQIFDYVWEDDFSKARNFALSKATKDWILVLDSDEYITSFNTNEVEKFITNNMAIGKIKRFDSFFNNDIQEVAVCYISRFFPRGVMYKGRIHEQLDSDLYRTNVGIEIYHDGYLERSDEKAQRNLRILKRELENKPSPYYFYQIAKEYNYLKDYENEKAFVEKAYSQLEKQSPIFPNLLVEYINNSQKTKDYARGLEIIEENKTKFNDFPDFHFACGLFYVDLVLSDVKKYISYFNLIEASFQKCLQIGENHKYEGVIGTGSFFPLHNLGSFYESMGNVPKAIEFYKAAAEYDYLPSKNRLKALIK